MYVSFTAVSAPNSSPGLAQPFVESEACMTQTIEEENPPSPYNGVIETSFNQSEGCRVLIWFCATLWLLLFQSICTQRIICSHPGEQLRFPYKDLRISAAGWVGRNS